MGLAAEMQWSLLPPLTVSSRAVTIAAVLEPAYDVSGDTFDYAVDPGTAKAAVFDGMGHGLRSAQMALLAVSAYRHARRSGASLTETCQQIDDALLDAFSGTSFTTALFTELDTTTGWLELGQRRPPIAPADPARPHDQSARDVAAATAGNELARRCGPYPSADGRDRATGTGRLRSALHRRRHRGAGA